MVLPGAYASFGTEGTVVSFCGVAEERVDERACLTAVVVEALVRWCVVVVPVEAEEAIKGGDEVVCGECCEKLGVDVTVVA
jgi:hypothetical protein